MTGLPREMTSYSVTLAGSRWVIRVHRGNVSPVIGYRETKEAADGFVAALSRLDALYQPMRDLAG